METRDLINQQNETGKILQDTINIYKQEIAAKRITLKSLKDILERCEATWDLFETTDTKIRSAPNPPLDHVYFKNEYYDKIHTLFHQYQRQISEQIAAIETGAIRKESLPAASSTKQADQQLQQPMQYSSIQLDDSTNQNYHDDCEAEMMRLQRRQNSVASSLRKLIQLLKNDCSSHPIQYYKLKTKILNDYWNQIENIKHTIWELSENPVIISDYDQLEDEVSQLIVQFAAQIDQEEETHITHKKFVSPSGQLVQPMIELPRITLPRFDGDYMKWQSFHDLFQKMIHSSSAMSDCQKLWHLKTSLTGEAEKLLRNFMLSDNNYVTTEK